MPIWEINNNELHLIVNLVLKRCRSKLMLLEIFFKSSAKNFFTWLMSKSLYCQHFWKEQGVGELGYEKRWGLKLLETFSLFSSSKRASLSFPHGSNHTVMPISSPAPPMKPPPHRRPPASPLLTYFDASQQNQFLYSWRLLKSVRRRPKGVPQGYVFLNPKQEER